MAPRKGTPEYEAWKNSPEYAERNQKLSASKKGKLFSAEARANMSAAQKASYANLTDEGKEKRRSTNNFVTGKGEIWQGRHHAEETKTKIAVRNKGKEPPNKGKPMSDKQKKELSELAMGRPVSEDTRAKLSAANKGRKYPGSGEAISKRLKGHVVSEETRAKIRASCKGRMPSFAGRKHTQASKEKMAIAASKFQKVRYAAMSPEERRALAERRIKSISLKNTTLEVFLAKQLDEWGITYIPQKHIGRYIADFLLPEQNLIIETNGCYWHACEQCGFGDVNEKHKGRDAIKIPFLEQSGYRVIVLWEHDKASWSHQLPPLLKMDGGG
jgi:G:T-mismatch repair DNA endonuclease (very short patch repair protein)